MWSHSRHYCTHIILMSCLGKPKRAPRSSAEVQQTSAEVPQTSAEVFQKSSFERPPLWRSFERAISKELFRNTSTAEVFQKSSCGGPPWSSAEVRGTSTEVFQRGSFERPPLWRSFNGALLKYLRRGGISKELF